MARTIDVTVSPEKTEALMSELRAVKGLKLQKTTFESIGRGEEKHETTRR